METNHLTKRIEDLRSETNARMSELRSDMNARLGEMSQRLGDVRDEMNQRMRSMEWTMHIWFGLLTLLILLFKFIKF